MFRFNLLRAGSLLTAVVTVVLAASPATAQQQGWPYNPSSNGYSGSRSTYPAPTTYVAPYGTPAIAPGAGQTEIRSFYPSAAGDEYGRLSAPSEANRRAWINVSVPANAQVLFENIGTAQRGAQRAFVSPPLDRGYDYVYHITAKWQDAGREVVRTREIKFHAGDVVNLGF
jgi:uncharacterized protein (TIGR03000 family)